MERYEWHERGEEGLRFFRTQYHAGRWAFFTTLEHEEDWSAIEAPTETLWRTLRERLWRKYQRKRCPWRLIEEIDKRLAKMAEPHES
jgi:hypothetical protein